MLGSNTFLFKIDNYVTGIHEVGLWLFLPLMTSLIFMFSSYCVIVWVRVVPKRTVVGD